MISRAPRNWSRVVWHEMDWDNRETYRLWAEYHEDRLRGKRVENETEYRQNIIERGVIRALARCVFGRARFKYERRTSEIMVTAMEAHMLKYSMACEVLGHCTG